MNIVRFNWPLFVGSGAVTLALVIGALFVTTPMWRAVLALVAVGVGGGTIVSLAVSHLIYDCSDLYRFAWLARALNGVDMHAATFCQTGFDESSGILAARTPATSWTVLDHYDPARMPEPSIQRARRVCPPAPGTIPAPFDVWPTPDASADVVIGMLAVHELRSEEERAQWFSEARRTLRAHGRIVVVEHVRDLANWLVFGPGAQHFHTVVSWQRCWTRARLRRRDQFRVTPWVRVFVLERA